METVMQRSKEHVRRAVKNGDVDKNEIAIVSAFFHETYFLNFCCLCIFIELRIYIYFSVKINREYFQNGVVIGIAFYSICFSRHSSVLRGPKFFYTARQVRGKVRFFLLQYNINSITSLLKANHLLYKQRCHQYCWGQQRVPPSWLVKYIGNCLLLSNQFFVLLYLFTFLLVSLTQLDCAHMQTSGQFKFALYITND